MKYMKLLLILCLPLLLVSCKQPQIADVELKKEAPTTKQTNYSLSLRKLGRLTKEFNTGKVRIQTTGVMDDTGTSQATGGEIPFDITEMIKSAVNSVGGNIVFIPYDPIYLKNQAALKMTTLDNKMRPDIVVNGGITEFDRSLEASSAGSDFGGEFGGGQSAVGIEAGSQDRDSTSSITLDLNLIDFESMAMIPRMQAVNTISVFKAASDTEIGFSLFGVAFGIKGSVKKIQGRHAAVRVLVDLSILEIVGKYLKLPYWKCLPSGAKPDPLVLENLREDFLYGSQVARVKMVQRLLPVYGFRDIRTTGNLDSRTAQAIHAIGQAYGFSSANFNDDLYLNLFQNVPVLGEVSKVSGSSAAAQSSVLSMPPASQSAAIPAPVASANAPLEVKVWSDKQNYRAGEVIDLYIQGNKDFYGKVVNMTSSGNIIQLLPNGYRNLDFFRGGITYRIPDTGDGYQLEVSPPFGQDTVVVYASEKPLPKVDMASAGAGLKVFQGNSEEFNMKTRGIKIAGAKAPKQPAPAPTAAAIVKTQQAMGDEIKEFKWVVNTSQ
ncbi:MAG: DUF4384 domain-containing protein [Desulfovibrio sp.]